jgi:hypothetical protein
MSTAVPRLIQCSGSTGPLFKSMVMAYEPCARDSRVSITFLLPRCYRQSYRALGERVAWGVEDSALFTPPRLSLHRLEVQNGKLLHQLQELGLEQMIRTEVPPAAAMTIHETTGAYTTAYAHHRHQNHHVIVVVIIMSLSLSLSSSSSSSLSSSSHHHTHTHQYVPGALKEQSFHIHSIHRLSPQIALLDRHNRKLPGQSIDSNVRSSSRDLQYSGQESGRERKS